MSSPHNTPATWGLPGVPRNVSVRGSLGHSHDSDVSDLLVGSPKRATSAFQDRVLNGAQLLQTKTTCHNIQSSSKRRTRIGEHNDQSQGTPSTSGIFSDQMALIYPQSWRGICPPLLMPPDNYALGQSTTQCAAKEPLGSFLMAVVRRPRGSVRRLDSCHASNSSPFVVFSSELAVEPRSESNRYRSPSSLLRRKPSEPLFQSVWASFL